MFACARPSPWPKSCERGRDLLLAVAGAARFLLLQVLPSRQIYLNRSCLPFLPRWAAYNASQFTPVACSPQMGVDPLKGQLLVEKTVTSSRFSRFGKRQAHAFCDPKTEKSVIYAFIEIENAKLREREC